MELLVLHATGLNWDEALALLAALAVLTLIVIRRLGAGDSAADAGQVDKVPPPVSKRRRR